MSLPPFDPRRVERKPDPPGLGDDVPCEKCGAVALDTGLECDECGHDNWRAVTESKPLRGFGVTITPGGARNWYAGKDGVRRWVGNDQPCDAGAAKEQGS